MSRQISRAEGWERAYEAFQQVNFSAFDFNTIKESLLDYLKLYYPEDYNSYIESDELIAIIELFAYLGEQVSYRLDMNAHENFITQAQRKESVLRLAKLISYNPSRNIPARGLVKITSIQTTEIILDSSGQNLANKRIVWNDSNNPNWKEQFLLVLNRVLEQEFGSVTPNERVQVDDVLFELYSWNNNPLSGEGYTVFPYSVTTSTGNYPMELVPVQLTENGPEEKRPEVNAKFTLLYGSDGLGDGSDTTGFFLFTKQGTLTKQELTFDGVTPNQTFDVNEENVNETDVWLNHIDPLTKEILIDDPYKDILPHMVSEDLRYGEWVPVNLSATENIIFNTNKNRHKFEVETLEKDKIRIVFGDGEFSDIPKGTFHLWYRTSANEDLTIPRSSVTNETASFTYTDQLGNTQTFTFTFALIHSLQNASPSEDVEHIRRVAPSVYYTQDRMVNGRDYNTFMLKDPSILKLRAVNRTFAGDSKYISWHDPRENYENVKIFGDDLALYWIERDPSEGGLTTVNSPLTADELIANYIQPLLCSTDFFAVLGAKLEQQGKPIEDLRCRFKNIPYRFDPSTTEYQAIAQAITSATTTTPIIHLYYSSVYDEWTVGTSSYGHPCDNETSIPPTPPTISGCTLGPADSLWMITIEAKFEGSTLSGWDIKWRTKRLIAHSEETRFWNANDANRTINYDTLNAFKDSIVVLQANSNAAGDGLLSDNKNYVVLGHQTVDQSLPDAGLPDIHRLSVLPEDTNNDNIPDHVIQSQLFDFDIQQDYDWFVTNGFISTDPADVVHSEPVFIIPNNKTYLVDHIDEDLEVYINGVRVTYQNGTGILMLSPQEDNDQEIIRNKFTFATGFGPSSGDTIRIIVRDYVYFKRDSLTEPWVPQKTTDQIQISYSIQDTLPESQSFYKRHRGRYPLNFAWFHHTPRYHLVDPAATNIIDIFIITKGYFLALRRYLEGQTSIEPQPPTSLDLRTSYANLLDNKMISDTVILHPGKFKLLFGSKAQPELRARFKVVRSSSGTLTDNEVKVRIVNAIRSFFDINQWEFGETLYITELISSIHSTLGPEIDSIVIVPLYSQHQFGDLFEVQAREDEMFYPDISTSDIEIVQTLTPENIRQ